MLGAVMRSVALRPLTEVYLIGVTMILLIVRGDLSMSVGIVIFGILTLVILLATVYGELLEVHNLLTSQNDALMKRVSDLLDVLTITKDD